jgi:hypothetical protein
MFASTIFSPTVKVRPGRTRGRVQQRLAEEVLDRLIDTDDPLERVALLAMARRLDRVANQTRGLRGWRSAR